MFNLLPLETEYSVLVLCTVFGIDIDMMVIIVIGDIDIIVIGDIDIIVIGDIIKYVYYKLFL